jgi:hypothetical protein
MPLFQLEVGRPTGSGSTEANMSIYTHLGPVVLGSSVDMEKIMYSRASLFTEVTDLLVAE